MANGGFFAGLAGGVAGGLQIGQNLDLKEKADRRAQEAHDTNQVIRKIGVKRLEAEQPVIDKELQVRGAQADYNLNEQNFLTRMQAHEQETRQLLAETNRTKAQTGAAAATAEAAEQPDRLKLSREKLNAETAEVIQRQTANVWGVLRLGNKELAKQMFNNSQLLMPGTKVKDFTIEAVDGPEGADGKPSKTRVLTIVPEGDGDPIRVPVSNLEALYNKYGAQYQKVGNALVRVGPNGETTPVYEQSKVGVNTETGGLFYESGPNVGKPVAAGGVPGAGGGGVPGGKREARVDDRVKMAIDKVILPRYGGRFEGGMFFPDEKNKDVATRATALAGEYIRGGMAPEAAGAKAINDAEREKKLKEAAGGAPANTNAPASGYTGPAPWRK